MKDMVEMTKANEVAKEQARKKEEEEAKSPKKKAHKYTAAEALFNLDSD